MLWNPICKSAVQFFFCEILAWLLPLGPLYPSVCFIPPPKALQIAPCPSRGGSSTLLPILSSHLLTSYCCWAWSEEQRGTMSVCYASFGQASSVKLFCKRCFVRGRLLLTCFLVGSTLHWRGLTNISAMLVSFPAVPERWVYISKGRNPFRSAVGEGLTSRAGRWRAAVPCCLGCCVQPLPGTLGSRWLVDKLCRGECWATWVLPAVLAVGVGIEHYSESIICLSLSSFVESDFCKYPVMVMKAWTKHQSQTLWPVCAEWRSVLKRTPLYLFLLRALPFICLYKAIKGKTKVT